MSVETLPDRCAIAIVGTGLLGVSTAYFLARSGVDVVVLNRGGIGAGSTDRTAGFVVSGPAESYPVATERYGPAVAHAVYQFTIENRELLRTAVAEDGIDCDYREQGCLSLATIEDEWLQHQDTHRTLQADDIPSQLLNRRELQARVGVPLKPHVHGARLAPEAGQIHPARLLYGLARSALRKGVRSAFPYNVTQLARKDNGWTLAVEDGHTRTRIEAEQVLCATNAWLPSLLPLLRA
jgi:glycine/D-amino acid oxidase-like deaminating enzyme